MVNLLFGVWFDHFSHERITTCRQAEMQMMVVMYVHKSHSSFFDGANISTAW